jgi:hypothetical protein
MLERCLPPWSSMLERCSPPWSSRGVAKRRALNCFSQEGSAKNKVIGISEFFLAFAIRPIKWAQEEGMSCREHSTTRRSHSHGAAYKAECGASPARCLWPVPYVLLFVYHTVSFVHTRARFARPTLHHRSSKRSVCATLSSSFDFSHYHWANTLSQVFSFLAFVLCVCVCVCVC